MKINTDPPDNKITVVPRHELDIHDLIDYKPTALQRRMYESKDKYVINAHRSGRYFDSAWIAKRWLMANPGKRVWVSDVRQVDLMVHVGIQPSQIVVAGEELWS